MGMHNRSLNRMLNLKAALSRLEKHNRVFIHHSFLFGDKTWSEYQKKEKAFWHAKLICPDYYPNPWNNFAAFFKYWGIPESYFRGKTVLEIGSGPFGFFSAIAQKSRRNLPDQLIIADSLMDFYQQFHLSNLIPDHAMLVQTPGEDIPFPNEVFDIVLTTNTIDHAQDCCALLGEINRLLKPEGILLFSVHTIPKPIKCFQPIIKMMDKNHPYHFTKDEILNLFEQNHYDILSETSVLLYKDDPVPDEAHLFRRFIFHVGFHLISTVYGSAKKI